MVEITSMQSIMNNMRINDVSPYDLLIFNSLANIQFI